MRITYESLFIFYGLFLFAVVAVNVLALAIKLALYIWFELIPSVYLRVKTIFVS